jgi:hypothetical protein
MKTVFLFAALLAFPMLLPAKGETTRIEIARGRHAVVTLEGPAQAGRFHIWTGPGTFMASADGTPIEAPTEHDFADWAAGPVEPPRGLEVFSVRFYCAARGERTRESLPSHQCYGVRYAYDRAGLRGYIQIPKAKDREFPLNTQSIYRGVEGSWYRASQGWEEVVGTALAARREADLAAQRAAEGANRQQRYYQPPSSTRAVSATPKITPKPR